MLTFDGKSNYLTKSLLLLSFLLCHSVDAKIYKWTDENGKVHYSDKPFNEESKTIKTTAQPSQKEILQAKQRASNFLRTQKKKREIEESDEKELIANEKIKEKEKKNLDRLCRQAKQEKINLGRGYRSYVENKQGERHFLSDKEKEEEISNLDKAISENCSN